MTQDLVSLAVIALVALICPIVAKLIPGKLIPETVFLLVAGALLGPYMAGFIQITDSVGLLSDLGLAFLFLLAGYEINPKELTGHQGKRGLIVWIITFALALAVVALSPTSPGNDIGSIAIAIALTTTALGTLVPIMKERVPIMKERELMGTRVGDSILAYGTWGELGPILAMAVLLSTRSELKTLLVLAGFTLLCVVMAVIPAKSKKAGHRMFRFLTENANTTSQTMVRAVIVLLVSLVAFSAVFDLDIVLGAFAAGFVLRYIIPEGDHELERKLEGIAYGFLIPVFFVTSGAKINLASVLDQPIALVVGFLIPVFFVTSGAKINLASVLDQPIALVVFIITLLLVRAVPIYFSLSTDRRTRDISSHNRLTIALYCTTALPIIVAVTSVAVKSDALTQEFASVLVAAGAITVFLMPLLASITYRVADVKPIEAAKEISQNPRDIGAIIREHIELERMIARREAAMRLAANRDRRSQGASAEIPWQDLAAGLQRTSARKRALDEALERKRALDEALDAAAQHLAANADAIEQEIERGADRGSREERRRRMAERAIMEHRGRMSELNDMLKLDLDDNLVKAAGFGETASASESEGEDPRGSTRH